MRIRRRRFLTLKIGLARANTRAPTDDGGGSLENKSVGRPVDDGTLGDKRGGGAHYDLLYCNAHVMGIILSLNCTSV